MSFTSWVDARIDRLAESISVRLMNAMLQHVNEALSTPIVTPKSGPEADPTPMRHLRRVVDE